MDPEGKFIKLKNNGSEDVPIGGWMIKDVGGDKEVMFKFHSRQMIKAGRNITVGVGLMLTANPLPIISLFRSGPTIAATSTLLPPTS